MNKRIFLLTALLASVILSAVAQTSSLTAGEKKFRDGIEQFLREEGYNVTIDPEDNSLNWKQEGARMWLTVSDTDPTYVEIHTSGFSVDADDNRDKILEACNRAVRETRSAKACLGKKSVIFTVELYCASVDDFNYVFYRSISALNTIKSKEKKYYNE